jgi:hypothetical protein
MIHQALREAIQKAPSVDEEMARARTVLTRIVAASKDPKQIKNDPRLRQLQKKGLFKILTEILDEHDTYLATPRFVRTKGVDTAYKYLEENEL